jgi:hypothetical protein
MHVFAAEDAVRQLLRLQFLGLSLASGGALFQHLSQHQPARAGMRGPTSRAESRRLSYETD